MSSPLSPSLLAQRAQAAAEPGWLSSARIEALESSRKLDAPKWPRTDLSGMDVEALAARASAAHSAPRRYQKAEGLVHMPLAQAAREHPDLVKRALATVAPASDKWERLHHAAWSDGALVFVEKAKDLAEPIRVESRHAPHGAMLRDVVLVERGARATVVGRAAGGGAGAFSMETLDVSVGENASLSLATLQDAHHGATLLSYRRARLARDASLSWIDGQFGGGKVRALNETVLDGQGSSLAFIGAFFGSRAQHFDITTSAWHEGRNTSSQLDMKGALSDDGYAVNYSIVNVGPEARNASGHQHQETLVLSEAARADAIPKLDVENNEVSASHGASVGQVDPEQVFYLRSRGFTERAAARLIVEGFFEPLLASIPLDDAREEIRAAIVSRMKE